jgi:Na+-transporting NADH:ubiquinone oxidoreductase subunit C
MDRNSNGYTFLFAGIMVVVVGALLAFAATSLKPMQDVNVKNEKMQNILSTIGVTDVSREEAQGKFDEFIKEQLALKVMVQQMNSVKAFNIDLKAEVEKGPGSTTFSFLCSRKRRKANFILFHYVVLDFGMLFGDTSL